MDKKITTLSREEQRQIDKALTNSKIDEQLRKENVERAEQLEKKTFNEALTNSKIDEQLEQLQARIDFSNTFKRVRMYKKNAKKMYNDGKGIAIDYNLANAIDDVLQKGDAGKAIKLQKPTQPSKGIVLFESEENSDDKNKGKFSKKIIEEQVNNGKQR